MRPARAARAATTRSPPSGAAPHGNAQCGASIERRCPGGQRPAGIDRDFSRATPWQCFPCGAPLARREPLRATPSAAPSCGRRHFQQHPRAARAAPTRTSPCGAAPCCGPRARRRLPLRFCRKHVALPTRAACRDFGYGWIMPPGTGFPWTLRGERGIRERASCPAPAYLLPWIEEYAPSLDASHPLLSCRRVKARRRWKGGEGPIHYLSPRESPAPMEWMGRTFWL